MSDHVTHFKLIMALLAPPRFIEFKYLGHMVSATLKDNVDLKKERRALEVRSNMLIRRFGKCSWKERENYPL